MAMSSSFSPKTYDVFISFRGEDTRKSFTSHLHNTLVSAGIRAYIDDPDLPKGDTVWEALCQAIHDSHIAIIVFSKNYVSSKWCLEEVMEILKCRESEGQVIIPVFYEVDPSDIRKQTGSYGEAFSKYDSMGENSNNQSIRNKVTQWKLALTQAANVSGWDSHTYRNESQLIKNIVNDVSQKLILLYPQEAKDTRLVGMDKIYEKVQQLLSKKKQEQLLQNVEVIGIWRMGGIGKTTIARVLFSRLFPLYDSVCFLENIRELSENNTSSKLKALSNSLLSELLKDENLKSNPSGSTFIARRLSSKKALIVLDDVDSINQLEKFREVYSYAGPKSTVILTTRDRHLLVGEVDEIYEAEMLSFHESLEIFCLHAFKQRCPREGYEELSKTAVNYAGAVPLALKVLGSDLYSRSTEFWECELKKVKNYPPKGIDNVLRVSYDGLYISEQKIFLDIAFFFKGERKDFVERILNACGFFATSGLQVLEDKALITVSAGRIQMHDLLQEMGLNIVRKGIEEPGKRSWLTDVGEVFDVLANKKGSDAVEGIILNLSHMDNLLHLDADSFSMMSKLRILKLYTYWDTGSSKVIYPQVFDKISDNLRYLEWHGYSLKSLPTNFSAKMLVEINMPYSHVTELWQGVQDVVNLKVIDLQVCKHLIRLPDLSKASKLREVYLNECESLLAVHPSILSLDTLEDLSLVGCKKLKHLKSDKHLRSLRNLSIRRCSGLKDFSISSDELEELYLFAGGIEQLHSSLGNLTKLGVLHIDGSSLRNLPNCRLSASLERLEILNCKVVMDKQKLHVLLEGLTHLRNLALTYCCKMSELPDNISGLSDLERLRLDGSSVEWLPESIKHLSKLDRLDLNNCKKLQWLPELPPNLTVLNAANCSKLLHILELPPSLEELNVSDCSKLEHIPELPPQLRELRAWNCNSLVTLSTSKVLAVMTQSTSRTRISMKLENCKKLDSQSFMESTMLEMMNILFHYKYGEIRGYHWEVCIPESKVPRQFKNRTKGSLITITLPPEPLLGFIFCVVISPSMIFNRKVHIHCRFYLPDDRHKSYWVSTYHQPSTDLHCDHAYIVVTSRSRYDCQLPLGQKLSFEFSCDHGDVKECGVHPVPMSQDVHRSILGIYSDLGIELDPDVAQRAEQGFYSHYGKQLNNNIDYWDSEIEISDDEEECNDQNNQDSDSDDDWLLWSDSESQHSQTLTLNEKSDEINEGSDQNNQEPGLSTNQDSDSDDEKGCMTKTIKTLIQMMTGFCGRIQNH